MANIKLKLGNLELEGEGPEDFLKTEVPNLLKLAVEAYRQIPSQIIVSTPAIISTPHVNGNGNGGAIPGLQSTTENLAVKIGVTSEPDLAVAASARLTFVLGKETFSRKEILKEMQTANAYYTTGHRKNMTNILRSLVKGDKLNERSADNYALSAKAKGEIEPKIRG
jgi:hypothetical protein